MAVLEGREYVVGEVLAYGRRSLGHDGVVTVLQGEAHPGVAQRVADLDRVGPDLDPSAFTQVDEPHGHQMR